MAATVVIPIKNFCSRRTLCFIRLSREKAGEDGLLFVRKLRCCPIILRRVVSGASIKRLLARQGKDLSRHANNRSKQLLDCHWRSTLRCRLWIILGIGNPKAHKNRCVPACEQKRSKHKWRRRGKSCLKGCGSGLGIRSVRLRNSLPQGYRTEGLNH